MCGERNGVVVFPLHKRFEKVAFVVFPTDESITVAFGCGRNKRRIVCYVLRFACKRFSAVYVESCGVNVRCEYRVECNVIIEPVRESRRRRADYGQRRIEVFRRVGQIISVPTVKRVPGFRRRCGRGKISLLFDGSALAIYFAVGVIRVRPVPETINIEIIYYVIFFVVPYRYVRDIMPFDERHIFGLD